MQAFSLVQAHTSCYETGDQFKAGPSGRTTRIAKNLLWGYGARANLDAVGIARTGNAGVYTGSQAGGHAGHFSAIQGERLYGLSNNPISLYLS